MMPCKCPLCRNPLRNLPHGSRTWHCSECGESITDGFVRQWLEEREDVQIQRLDAGPRMLPMPRQEVSHAGR